MPKGKIVTKMVKTNENKGKINNIEPKVDPLLCHEVVFGLYQK